MPAAEDFHGSEADAVRQLRAVLADAVKCHLLSDVPLGAFLSGGIDSSLVVGLMAETSGARVKTFSIGFDEPAFDELEHARRVAQHFGTDHHEFVVKPDAVQILDALVSHFDEPFADSSMIPTWYVSEMARRHVTVALSGDGGDEAYAGYTTYAWARDYARVDAVPRPLRRAAGWPAALLHADHPLGRKLRRAALDPVDRHLEVMSYFPPRDLRALLSRDVRAALRRHDPFAAPRASHARAAAGAG